MESLAIVIPCLNEERFIYNCIKSLVKSIPENLRCEIYVVCGDCKDQTIEEVIKSQRNFNNKNLEIIITKASDVPLYIDSGKIDLGIVGVDTLMEDDKNNHFRLCDMTISKCKLVVAGKAKTKYFNNMKVATKYPKVAKKYFKLCICYNIFFSLEQLLSCLQKQPFL